jgi:sirohydrochlorin cobaltochelatase
MTATTQSTPAGIILFAHGSRDPLWKLPIQAVAQRIGELQPTVKVECAFLELTTPDLPSVAAQMIASGVNQIRIMPMFLGVGRHAREDLPVLIAQLQAEHPQVHFELQAAIGENPLLIDLMAQIAIDP